MPRFVFNRRVIEDQRIFIDAHTLPEAWQRARKNDADDTDDPDILKTTYRFIEIED